MGDEEAVDVKEALEKKCEPSCSYFYLAYTDCAKRIEGSSEAHCTGQFLDYTRCIDHCVRRFQSPLPSPWRPFIAAAPRHSQISREIFKETQ